MLSEKPVQVSRLAILALALPFFATGGQAISLAPTQLKGLGGVNVYVDVVPEVRSVANDIENTIKKKVEEALVQAGLSTVARNSEGLKIRVDARSIENRKEQLFALFISVRLREHVSLKRDASLDVPGGGAFTWWREGLLVSSRENLLKNIEETVLSYLELFTEEVQVANRLVTTSKQVKQK